MTRLLSIILTCALLAVLSPTPTIARTEANEYVRTANYFLLSGPKLDAPDTVQSLSNFDLIVIPVEAQVYNKGFFTKIREMNPDIVILAYVATVSWNDIYWNAPLRKKLFAGIESSFWLKDGNGNQTSVWPNTRALNLNTGWKSYLSSFVENEVMASGLWDGVFYDEVQDSISWLGNVDVNKDGAQDSNGTADSIWAQRYMELFAETRARLGKDAIIITNGSSNPAFAPHVNGRMFETFPSSTDSLNQWAGATRSYKTVEQTVGFDPVNVINVNSENTGVNNDYQKVRFGITTTLLGNGYFAFDYGTENHAQLWEYDEYDAYLGAPKSGPKSIHNPQATVISPGVWQREFEQGTVIVNATTSEQTIELDGDFEKLHGTQDVTVNNGRIVSEITLASQDGIVLLRPVERIENATYLNGSFARIFNASGRTTRTGFFAYESSQRGGTQVVRFDTDSDGQLETVVADDTFIYIYETDGSLHAKVAPYTEAYDQGINISVGDIEDDGSVEIVTGTERGGGPQVRVFNKDGVLINPGFFAYSEDFRGGVNVAIGDLNNDNIKEIICGAGVGGGPHVRVFKKDGTLINPGFFAYNPAFRGGVNVAVGDVDGDGIGEVVTGPGFGGGPHVRVYDRDGNMESEFFVLGAPDNKGIDVTATDLDGDFIDEIIGLTTDVFTFSFF